jgi:hypothetical protein
VTGVDAKIVEHWVCARCLAKGLPQPVADRGGWRVDTNTEEERRRFVFAHPDPGITELASEIVETRVFLKLAGPDQALMALLPERWKLQEARTMMIRLRDDPLPPELPAAFGAVVSRQNGANHVEIRTADGELAASGSSAVFQNVYTYDSIETRPQFRRRGLGIAVMRILGDFRPKDSIELLVATEEGSHLYTRLGWSLYSPYATAVIEDDTPQS